MLIRRNNTNVNFKDFTRSLLQSPTLVVLTAIAGATTLGVLDYITGPKIGVTVFYLIPVMFATWYARWFGGITLSLISGLAWFTANALTQMEEGVIPGYIFWNAGMRTVMYFVVAVLLFKFKNLKDDLERIIIERTAILREKLARELALEKALSASEKVYKDLVENAAVGVFKSNVWGELLYVNPAMVQMFEFDSQEEMLTRSALMHYENVADRERFLEELKRYGKVTNFELQLLTKHHHERTVLVSASLDNNIISGMLRDVTTQKALEKHLTEIQRWESLGTLAGGIAHDFNNILGIILGHAATVQRFIHDPHRVKRGMEAIISASQRGSGLVRQLLTFARKAEVQLETAHLNTIVADVARLLSETFPKTITIQTKLGGGLPLITADVNQMHQVLINLCVNARDAMPNGGRLTLATRIATAEEMDAKFPGALSQHYVVAEVHDTGTGMSEEVRRRVFEPFFTTKERGKGTGLGLAVVYGIVEGHAGYIDVVSTPGEGSTFTVYLPAKAKGEGTQPTRAEFSEALASGTKTILIVEDEAPLLELAQAVLETHGYTVITSTDGEHTVATYRERWQTIDLVISDLGLPKLNGIDVFQQLLEINPQVRFILTSGYIDPEQKAQVLPLGAKHVLQKPYTPNDLQLKVRTALDA